MVKKGNIVDSAVQAHEQEQEKLTTTVTAATSEQKAKQKITLSITEEDSITVKTYAIKIILR